jgi:hypothetical protein
MARLFEPLHRKSIETPTIPSSGTHPRPGTHPSRESAFTACGSSWRNRNLRHTRSCRRRHKRRRYLRHFRWMELPGPRPSPIRWHVPDRRSRRKSRLQNLCRTAKRRRRPRRSLQRHRQPLSQYHHRPRLAPAPILRSPQSQPRIHYRNPLFPIDIPNRALGFFLFLLCHPDRNGRSSLPRRSLARRPWSGGTMATLQPNPDH